MAENRWNELYLELSVRDERSALPAPDLESLATAAFLTGHTEAARSVRLRAYHLYVAAGDRRAAARSASWLGVDQLGPGEVAEASGCLPVSATSCSAWIGQAAALLGRSDSPEQGLLLVPVAYERLVMDGDPTAGARIAGDAVAIGRRFGDPDVLAFALSIHGRCLVRSDRVAEGKSALDESVGVVTGGTASPIVTGITLTSAIEASEEIGDVRRFAAWSGELLRWSERQHGLVAFMARALGHRARLGLLSGSWDDALDAARKATDPAVASADPTAAAIATYLRAELLRLRGDRDGAEAAYRDVSRIGGEPQPGLALLRLAEGDVTTALVAITRLLAETTHVWRRARILPAAFEVLLYGGAAASAAAVADELEGIANALDSPALDAEANHARGAVLLSGGDAMGALGPLRRSLRIWLSLGVRHAEARTRVLIARCCRVLGDNDAAALELDVARRIFGSLGAQPELDACAEVATGDRWSETHGLTRRELEVLRLLATGMTNRAIAGELSVTVRTVDTHVSSILGKLAVSTRAAATSYAYRHGIV
ncbi:MAG TPA: LuxR C-terminal-related transcriptional regulator [Candidatus Limnocylindrales bacterium]|nr:LuxR C-terminal-related transcriptional regulator [Candidatus Limnocylindrales bacterium]